MPSKQYFEAISQAQPHPQVEAALNDDPIGAQIVTDQCPDAFVASRLFNVATAAMDILRKEPETPVIESPVKVEDGAADRLGRFTMRILNDSLLRRQPHKNAWTLTSLKMKKVGTCGLTEERFAEAAGYFGEIMLGNPSHIYTSRFGEPILFAKEIGQGSAISFKQLSLNRVRYPAGTIFVIEPDPEAPSVRVDKYEATLFKPSHIRGLAPLRYATMAFPPKERPEILLPIEGYTNSLDDEDVARYMTLAQLLGELPARPVLHEAIRNLNKK